MSRKSSMGTLLRTAMIASAFLLPALSLIPLGSLWLWQNGYLLYWVGAALLLSATSYGVQLWLIRPPTARLDDAVATAESAAPEPSWTPREAAAWNAVEALAEQANPSELTSRDALVELGLRTIEAVARCIHPLDRNPLWNFTVPEALALVERVSGELRPFVVDNIPLGDQLTVTQVLKIYRWRSAIDVAEKAYDLWRIVRLVNPIAAVTNEARERLTKKLYAGVRDELAMRLTQGYIRAIGRAAIDLYGGRLRVTLEDLAAHVSNDSRRDQPSPESADPLRFLVGGQIGAGKSHLINALLDVSPLPADLKLDLRAATSYPLFHAAFPPAVLIDSSGVRDDRKSIKGLVEEAGRSDLLIWVAAANRTDRSSDRAALDAIRAHFDDLPDRRPPPVLVVATHSVMMEPHTVAAAVEQISVALAVAADNVVAVAAAGADDAYEIELVWSKLTELLPAARHAHLIRRMRNASGWKWGRIWSQAVNASRTARQRLTKL